MDPRELFIFHAPLIDTRQGPAVVLDRAMAEELVGAIERWLDKPPVIELIECIVCHVYSAGECKHG